MNTATGMLLFTSNLLASINAQDIENQNSTTTLGFFSVRHTNPSPIGIAAVSVISIAIVCACICCLAIYFYPDNYRALSEEEPSSISNADSESTSAGEEQSLMFSAFTEPDSPNDLPFNLSV